MLPSDDRSLLEPGDMFGDYTVVRLLGTGGMGAVYLLRAPGDELYAAKIMFPEAAKQHGFRKRFAREAEFAMKLHHENIVSVYDVGEDPETGFCYIIMEYVPGGSLADRMEKTGPMPVKEALSLAMRIAVALEAAHSNGLVHRDVKPDNILFTASGTPKLADLGVAKFDDRKTNVTTTGMVVGTPAYMAPEQMMDSRNVDARADIYSLGLVLFEMLTGKRPNEGSTAVELIAKAIKGEPLPDVRTMRPEISAAVAYVLSLMCAPKPEDRPQTSLAVAQLLQKAATGKLVLPRKTPLSSIVKTIKSNAKRKRMAVIALAVTGASAILVWSAIGVAYFFWKGRAGERNPAKSHVAASLNSPEGTDARQSETADIGSNAEMPVWGSETNSNVAIEALASNRRQAGRSKGRNGAAGRRVRQSQVGGTTWHYTLKGGEAVIWRGNYGYSDATLPAFEPDDAEHVVVPAELDGYKVSSIGSLAFFRCRMKSVVIPEGVRSLGAQAFYGCSALENVKLPFTLDIIDRNVFEKCVSLERLDIGECPYVTGSSFNCPNLSGISVAPSNHEYKEADGCLLSRNSRELVFFPRTGSVAIFPSGVEEIGEGAFMGCTKLKKVTIPGRVRKVGALAFAYCRNLSSVEFQPGVQEVDDRAFAYCPNLKRVSFPNSLGRIGTLLFDRCPSLQVIEFNGDAPQADLSESLFGDTPETLRIFVRHGSKGWMNPGSAELPERWPAGPVDDSREIGFADDASRNEAR